MGKNEEKWLRNGDFLFFTYGYPNLVYYSLLDVLTKFQVNWSTKTRFIYIIVFSYFQYIWKSREENAKWEKEQFIRKKWKSFCSIDLKVYKHLHTYKTQLHTKFGRILNSLSGILVGFSGILHNLEIFWQHGRIRLLWKTPNSCKIRTSYPIAPIFWLVTYLSDPKIPTNFLPVTISGSTITARGWFPPPKKRHVNL